MLLLLLYTIFLLFGFYSFVSLNHNFFGFVLFLSLKSDRLILFQFHLLRFDSENPIDTNVAGVCVCDGVQW